MDGLKKKKNFYQHTKLTNYRLNSGERKPDSNDYDEILLEFIKEGYANDMAITFSEIIYISIELIPGLKKNHIILYTFDLGDLGYNIVIQ